MPESTVEKIYYRLPYKLQNVAFSLYGLKQRRNRYGNKFYKHLEKLKESEWISKQKMNDYQDEQISGLVQHAYQTIPFYKKWYDEHGVDISQIESTQDLCKLPILTKELVKKNQTDLISAQFDKKKLHKQLTSGTTGTPLSIYQTSDSLQLQWAIFWRFRERFGIHFNDRHLTFGARVPISQRQQNPPYWRQDYFNNRVYLSTSHISENTVDDIVDYLNSTQFTFYTGYPSSMAYLAHLMDKKNLRLVNKPKIVFSASDALTEGHKNIIGKIFGAPITEFYGNVEFAGTMSKCEHGLFHADYEHSYIETIEDNRSRNYELILTGWGNKAMPFIRYKIGDYGIPVETECTCGRKSKTFAGIEGRQEDYIYTPDGRKLIGMNQVFEYAENAVEIQLYQKEKNRVTFRVVPGNEFGSNDKQALIREFRRRAGSAMKIEFQIVDSIDKASSGKHKAVISEIDNFCT